MAAGDTDQECRQRPQRETLQPGSRRSGLKEAGIWRALVVGFVASCCVDGVAAQQAGRVPVQQPANGAIFSAFLGRSIRISFLSSLVNDATSSWGSQTVLDERVGLPPLAVLSCGASRLTSVVGCQGGNLTISYQPRPDQVGQMFSVCATVTSTRNGLPIVSVNTTNTT